MIHDPIIAEIRSIRAQLLAECGGDLQRLCESLRADEARLAVEGHAIIPAPMHPGLAEKLRDMLRQAKIPA